MTPTLDVRPGPVTEASTYVLDCPHGTTTATVFRTPDAPLDDLAFRLLVARHEAEEGCGCAIRLQPVRGGASVSGRWCADCQMARAHRGSRCSDCWQRKREDQERERDEVRS